VTDTATAQTDTATAQELFDSAHAALWAMQARGQDPDWGVECFEFCDPYELTISAFVEIEWNGSAALCLVTICDEDDISLECEGARADIHFARLGGVRGGDRAARANATRAVAHAGPHLTRSANRPQPRSASTGLWG